jgi:hypothetical protein
MTDNTIDSEIEDRPIIAEFKLDDVGYLLGDHETLTPAQCLLKRIIEKNDEDDHFAKKRQVWEQFRDSLEDDEHRHLHLAEIVGSWFYKNFNPIKYKLDAIEQAKERNAKGEFPQRELGIGDKVAITIAGWPKDQHPVDYVGYPATFEDCVAVAIKRISEIKAETKFEWAIVLGAEIVGTTPDGEYQHGKHHLVISDPKEYYLDGMEPGKFFKENQMNENSGFALGGVFGLDWRHPVATLLIYPDEWALKEGRELYGY